MSNRRLQRRSSSQERMKFSENDDEEIARILQEFRAGRMQRRQAQQQLRRYVPEEQESGKQDGLVGGMGMDDLLPLVGLVLGDSQIRGGLGNILGRFLGGREGFLGGLFGGSSNQSTSDNDLRDVIGNFLDNRGSKK